MNKISGIILAVTAILGTAIACTKAEATGGTFEFKSIYLPEKSNLTARSLGLNTLDDDWGIWGHNLGLVVPERHSNSIYAKVDEEINKEQFCFSSNKLFDYICDYIDDNYGLTDKVNFAILPNDNDIVCQCRTCIISGNTDTDASGAVFSMINKLATQYPNHTFFTSYYNSTKNLPSEKMPSNSGVLISAMEYPLTAVSTSKEENFENLLKSWKEQTDKIYVWDYINNFDDYYTPSPILSIMQHRLQMYRKAGVNGVFLNGSGYDYSTFSDIKFKTLATLLQDPDADWEKEVRDYSKELYPVSGDLIADYIISQEKHMEETGAALPMYEGVKNARKTYLDESEFIKFHDALLKNLEKTSGKERKALEEVAQALCLTRLELMRENGNIEGSDYYVALLEKDNENLKNYGESYWPVASYVRDFKFMKEHHDAEGKTNLLKGVKLTPRTHLDEDYNDISILTDGFLGIPSNYHSGNMLSSADPYLAIAVPKVGGMRRLRLWMVKNLHYRIGLPTEVMLKIGGLKYDVKNPEDIDHRTGRAYLDFDIPVDAQGEIDLIIYKDPETKTIAIDEIEAYGR